MSVQPVEAAWTAHEVNRALFAHFTAQSWAPLLEVTVQPEETVRDVLADPSGPAMLTDEVWQRTRGRRVDMLLIRRARKPGIGDIERIAIEVKVTRQDFLNDIRNPFKQQPARDLAHRHAFAVPDGLVDPDEVPKDSGLIVVKRLSRGNQFAFTCEWRKRAPHKTPPPGPMPDWMILTLAYRASWAEATARGLTVAGQHLGDDPAALRIEVQRLEAETRKADRKFAREADKARAWRDAYAAAGGLPCAFCGSPLKPKGLRGGWWTDWVHTKRAAAAACDAKRTELAEHNARTAFAQAETNGIGDRTRRHIESRFPAEPWRYYFTDIKPKPADDDDQESTDDE